MKIRMAAWIAVVAMMVSGSANAGEMFAGLRGCDDGSACCEDGCESACCDGLCSLDSGCDSCCGDSCGRIFDGSRLAALTGMIQSSDKCFDDFVSPMMNFVFFEDPRQLTELRPIFLHHRTPAQVGTLPVPGGDIQLYALQFRARLSERLSLIAVKDGYIVTDIADGPLNDLLSDGWASVTAGLKYTLIRDTCSGTLLSAGGTYELPIGSRRSLQAIGDGEFHFFLSGGQRLWDGNAHVLSTIGYRLPVDDALQTTSIHWSNHFDVRLTNNLYAVTELAWWHVTESATDPSGLPVGFTGQDLLNYTATNVAGNDLVSQGVGMKYKPKNNVELGAIYEFPLTSDKDVLEDRWTFDMIYRF